MGGIISSVIAAAAAFLLFGAGRYLLFAIAAINASLVVWTGLWMRRFAKRHADAYIRMVQEDFQNSSDLERELILRGSGGEFQVPFNPDSIPNGLSWANMFFSFCGLGLLVTAIWF